MPRLCKSNKLWVSHRCIKRKYGDWLYYIDIRKSKTYTFVFIKRVDEFHYKLCYKRKTSKSENNNFLIAIALSHYYGYNCLYMLD